MSVGGEGAHALMGCWGWQKNPEACPTDMTPLLPQGIVNYRTREDAAALNLTYFDSSSGSFFLQPDLVSR